MKAIIKRLGYMLIDMHIDSQSVIRLFVLFKY